MFSAKSQPNRNLTAQKVSQATMPKNKLPPILPLLLACATVLGALMSCAPTTALASHGEAIYFEGSTDLLSPVTRPHAIAQMQALGVKALRVELPWYEVAPRRDERDQAQLRSDQPRQLRLGRIRRAARTKPSACTGRCC